MIERDYAEALKAEFDMENQSEGFIFNRNLFIEVSTYEYHDKYLNYVRNEENVKVDLHSHFSYDSDQNAATTGEQIKIFIHWMYEGKNIDVQINCGYYQCYSLDTW